MPNVEGPVSPKCASCQRSDDQLLMCGRCRSARYCNRACQKNNWPHHRAGCIRQNYILKVDLFPRFIKNPRITRTISCPATATFAMLHKALQIAFGWAGTHLYDFDVFDHTDTMGRKKRILGPEPILRLTDMSDRTASYLPNSQDSLNCRLCQILDHPTTKGKTIYYLYDFGDGWEHVVVCIGRAGWTEHFECLEGEGHECAEDVGGHSGWQRLLEAYEVGSKEVTESQYNLMKWYEERATNGQKLGLAGDKKWKWDKEDINQRLKSIG